jgi:hypothetical protein
MLNLLHESRGVAIKKVNQTRSFVTVIFSLTFLAIFSQFAYASTAPQPAVKSFTFSPSALDISNSNSKIVFHLIVDNPSGIATTQTVLTVTDGGLNTFVVPFVRTDNPVNYSLRVVKFEASISGSSLQPGVYTVSSSPITSLNVDGTLGLSTSTVYATSDSTVIGGLNSLLIRSNGNLNYYYPTFTGPAYNKAAGITFRNSKFYSAPDPIWKVGETFNPSNYFELNVPSLSLKVGSTSPKVCTSTGNSLIFIGTGGCSFSVYTDKTSDYQYFSYDQTVTITDARVKPVYVISSIPTQSSSSLPISIPGPYVVGPNGLVIPVSATPSVCFGAGFYINIISGGTCTLIYSTPGTSTYLPSDLYTLTFQISRTTQSLTFIAPANAALASKSLALSASASSGQVVTFLSSTPAICTVTGNSLNLLKFGTCQVIASQNGTATFAPVSVVQSIAITGTSVLAKQGEKLTCVKNGKSKAVFSGSCPPGYKAKK